MSKQVRAQLVGAAVSAMIMGFTLLKMCNSPEQAPADTIEQQAPATEP